MAVETRGTVQLRGETSPPTPVDVYAGSGRIRLTTHGGRPIGDWELSTIGMQTLMEGFLVRAEGEELILVTDDDPAVAEELGIRAASPRLARRIAASHPPDERDLAVYEPAPSERASGVPGLLYALAGLLVISAGLFLRANQTLDSAARAPKVGLGPEGNYWLTFVIIGFVMALVGFFLTRGWRWARWIGLLAVVAEVVLLTLAVVVGGPPDEDLVAYGFAAAGLVVGMVVLSRPALRSGG